VPRSESAFSSLIRRRPHQRPPRRVPISRARRWRQRRQDREPLLRIARRVLHSALTLVQKSRRLPGIIDRGSTGRCRHPTSPTPSKRLVRRPARCEPAPRVSRAGLYRAPRQRKAHHEPPEDGGHHNASLFPQERANGDNLGQAVVRASPQSNVGVGPSQRRRNMKIASTLSVAFFLAGLSVATWTSLASAQQPPGWAAAAAQCRLRSGVNIRPPKNPRV
jgi:hypothetical protein